MQTRPKCWLGKACGEEASVRGWYTSTATSTLAPHMHTRNKLPWVTCKEYSDEESLYIFFNSTRFQVVSFCSCSLPRLHSSQPSGNASIAARITKHTTTHHVTSRNWGEICLFISLQLETTSPETKPATWQQSLLADSVLLGAGCTSIDCP